MSNEERPSNKVVVSFRGKKIEATISSILTVGDIKTKVASSAD